MEGYNIIENLGDGSYGTVTKARNPAGEIVAIKTMKTKYKDWNECLELREVKSLRKLKHPNIIKLKEAQLIKNQLFMVFEYCDQNLYQYYQKFKERNILIQETQICKIIHQITLSLAYMHKNGFFHRDLKPENILIQNDIVKLCDFGLAREIRSRPPFTEYVSTRWYRSPEIILKSTNYNSPSDLFALGCIMAELYLLGPLFAGNSSIDQLIKILKIMGTPSQEDWPDVFLHTRKKAFRVQFLMHQQKQFLLQRHLFQLKSTLHYDPNKRPAASQLLSHPYFEKFLNNSNHNHFPEIRLKSRGSQNIRPRSREKNQQGIISNEKQDRLPSISKPFIPSIQQNQGNIQNVAYQAIQQPFQYKNIPSPIIDSISIQNQIGPVYTKKNSGDYLKNIENRNQDQGMAYYENKHLNNIDYGRKIDIYNPVAISDISKDVYYNRNKNVYKGNIYDFQKPVAFSDNISRVSPYVQPLQKIKSPTGYKSIKPQYNVIYPQYNNKPKVFSDRIETDNPYIQGLRYDRQKDIGAINQRNQQFQQKYGNFQHQNNLYLPQLQPPLYKI